MRKDKNKDITRNRGKRRLVIIIIMVISIISVLLFNAKSSEKEISYSEIVTCVEKGNVTKISTDAGSNKIVVTFKDKTQKFAYVPSVSEFWKYINEQRKLGKDIEISVNKYSFDKIISSSIKTLPYVFMIFYLIMVMGNGNFKVKAATTNVSIKDIAGIDEEKEQVMEIVRFLKEPKKYTNMGARIPKGILLVGSPGTGKTLLAKAIASEAGVPFFQVTGSSFEEKFVGVGAARVRSIFRKAKKAAPSIIFIDEIDAVARNRYEGRTYSEQSLNQMLAEMDGFNSDSHVIVIAATNHKEVLDPAILRAGRFDRHIHISLPNVKARAEILKVHAKNKKLSDDVNLEELARKTVGFSGAYLENILNEAALIAVRTNSTCITNEIIDEAIARVLVGIKKEESILSAEEKYLTAVHEAGHAIVSAVVRPNVKNFCISIVPRGEAGGYNFFDESYRTYNQKEEIKKQIEVLYGGRCAEECILKDISSGASNDLEKATDLAYNMVMKFAMSDSKLVKITGKPEFNNYIEKYSIEKVEKICSEAYEKVSKIVSENEEVISRLAALLMDKEYLSDIEVSAFLSRNLIQLSKKESA